MVWVSQQWWQRGVGSVVAAAAARRQRGGSTVAVRRRQLGGGGGGGGSTAAEAAVGDGRDEGGEVVTWRLFMFVIFLHMSSVPVNRAKGLSHHNCVCVKFTLSN